MITTTNELNKTQWSNLFKFTNKKDFRKILTGVHFTNEYAVVTDSHRVAFILDDFSHNTGKTLDKEFNEIVTDRNYPNMGRFLESEFNDTNNHFKVDVNEFLNIHKDLLPKATKNNKDTKHVILNVSIDERVFLYVKENENKFEPMTSFRTWKYDECIKAYNCKFMIDALTLFKSFKQKEVIIKFREKLTPISLESPDGKVKVLIMPIRLT